MPQAAFAGLLRACVYKKNNTEPRLGVVLLVETWGLEPKTSRM